MLEHVSRFYAKDRAAWRSWLMKHHDKERSVWLVYDKKDGKGVRALGYGDIVEEALCFGWIDSLPRKLSDTQAMLYVAKRKPTGEWSKLNKSRVAALKERGLMHSSGLALVSLAKKNGAWNKIDASENHRIPDFFARELEKTPRAKANFEAFAPSWRKMLLHKLLSAKTEATKAKRLALVMSICAEGMTAQEFRTRYIDKKK